MGRMSGATHAGRGETACFLHLPVHFSPHSTRLSREAEEALDYAFACSKHYPGSRIVLDGHSTTAERREIALQRALAARDYVISRHRFPDDRIIVRSFAAACPAADPAYDRRVEHFVLPVGREPNEIVKQCGRNDRE